uniref:Reverse transcriptase zinc-binding domain-containing protein n=1 Tax=Arundo donax TaxID=35708 RepID=A0A0A8ZJV0_ARUDO
MDDLQAWHYDPKGVFSVKSAYHVLQDQQDRETPRQVGESSSATPTQLGESLNWQKLWRLSCPPKIKQFLWRLAHDILPTRMNIRRRGMDVDTRCPVCMRFDEDGCHCFLKCKFARHCWQDMNLDHIQLILAGLESAEQVLHHILGLEEIEQIKICVLMWVWWEERNKVNAGEQRRVTAEATKRARNMISDIVGTLKEAKERPRRPIDKWLSPQPDVLKIKFDGAFLES